MKNAMNKQSEKVEQNENFAGEAETLRGNACILRKGML
jgi:hypothetical protein